VHKLPKKQFWYCWCGRFVWTDSSDKLTLWLKKHLGGESRCQKYRILSPIYLYVQFTVKINNWYWGKRLTTKLVTMDETGVTTKEIKP